MCSVVLAETSCVCIGMQLWLAQGWVGAVWGRCLCIVFVSILAVVILQIHCSCVKAVGGDCRVVYRVWVQKTDLCSKVEHRLVSVCVC